MARYLLDTHALLFWLDGDKRLSPRARRLIQPDSNEILVSAASVVLERIEAMLDSRGPLPG
jgi:PIN domain nuclease of toxin-antitoxin system